METLKKSTPEQQGIASAAISAFIDEANETVHDLHSLILLRHGQIVAEGWWSPYETNDPHIMYSLSKSFTSTAVGLAVAEGKLKVTDPVISFFPDEVPPVISPNLAAMQVRHLLSMSTGHAEDTTEEMRTRLSGNWAQTILSLPVVYEPGTHFLYNTGATYLLSAIVQKVTGQTLLEYLEPRLFAPLGIENPGWENSPQGVNTGGFGLGITTADVARFGQLYLQKGLWQGKRLLPQEWVEEATRSHISNGTDPNSDWTQGYAYQFWRCRHGAYRGDGAFGQFCLVMPEQDAVLAVTAGLWDMQAVLNLVWKHLLPALEAGPLPENRAAAQGLAQKLEHLEIAPVKDRAASSIAASVSGQRFGLDNNAMEISAVSFDFDQAGCVLTIENASGMTQVNCGNGSWQKGINTLNHGLPRKAAASGSWTDQQTYLINLYFLTPILTKTPPAGVVAQSPFGLTITCQFTEDRVSLELQANVAFGDNKPFRLQGRLA